MAIIIILDDVLDAGVLIQRILQRKNHTVHVFSLEQDAINFVRKHHVDLALLDLKLQHMTGIEVLQSMKEYRPDLKAIILTGYPTLETARAALGLGVQAYCAKPIDKFELESRVHEVLQLALQ